MYFKNAIVRLEISILKFVYLQNSSKKLKCINFEPKMTDLCNWRLEFENDIVIFEISTLEFVLGNILQKNRLS